MNGQKFWSERKFFFFQFLKSMILEEKFEASYCRKSHRRSQKWSEEGVWGRYSVADTSLKWHFVKTIVKITKKKGPMGEGASDPGIPPPLATCLGKVNLTRQANDMSLHASFFCSGRSIWKKLIFSIKQTSHFHEIQWPTIFTRHFTSACQLHSRALPFKLEKYCKCCDMNAVLLLVFTLDTAVPYLNDHFSLLTDLCWLF